MNKTLLDAMGIKINMNEFQRTTRNADIAIYRMHADDRLNISFAQNIAKKLGKYVLISKPWKDRLYFFSCSENEYGKRTLSMPKGSNARATMQLSDVDHEYDCMIGNYDLRYSKDLDAYYINAADPFKNMQEVTA